jgi:hypothetical protein
MSVSEVVILRKLIADGDGTSEDKRICQLIQLIQLLGKPNEQGRDDANKRFLFPDLFSCLYFFGILVFQAKYWPF